MAKKDIDVITSQATKDKPKDKPKSDTTSRLSPSDKIGPNFDVPRRASRVDNSDGSKVGPDMGKVNKPKPKAKPTVKKLKDTSGDYYTADGISGDMGSASGEMGANMGQVNKGGYDADSDGMKRGGKVKKMAGGGSASSRGDGCAQRGKTKGRFV
jgi:hypothetical protein